MANKPHVDRYQISSKTPQGVTSDWYVIIDTHLEGHEVVCITDNEMNAIQVTHALNFSYRPGDYGYDLVD